jgi:hypothetical protein
MRRLAVDAECGVGAEASAVAERGSLPFGANADGGQRALGVVRGARDHIDDAVDRIGAPEGSARPADHLDALDVLEQHVLLIPEDAREERRVDRATVDQHQQLVRDRVVEAAGADCELAGVALRHVQVRRQPQRLGQRQRAGAPDVFGGDDVNGRRGIRNRFT